MTIILLNVVSIKYLIICTSANFTYSILFKGRFKIEKTRGPAGKDIISPGRETKILPN